MTIHIQHIESLSVVLEELEMDLSDFVTIRADCNIHEVGATAIYKKEYLDDISYVTHLEDSLIQELYRLGCTCDTITHKSHKS